MFLSYELFIWYTDSRKKIGFKHRGLVLVGLHPTNSRPSWAYHGHQAADRPFGLLETLLAAMGSSVAFELTGAYTNMEASANRNALVPVVLLLGIGSIVCSEAINNYWGMAIAIVALVTTQFGLKNVSRSVWIWCVTLATTGFALGLAALLMRIFIDTVRR